jgi:hypothetical protein
MSAHLNQQVTAISNNLTNEQRGIMTSIQQGQSVTPNARTLGQMVRAGLITIGATGGLALSNVGNRVVSA